MDINLKVSPAELEAKATDFKGVMSQIKTLTDDMMADVTGLSSTWTGDASAAYISKKFHNSASFYEVPILELGTKADLGRAVGEEIRAVLVVTKAGFAAKLQQLAQTAENAE